jgi:hypothetical protein
VTVVEGSTGNVGMRDLERDRIIIHPSPASDMITVSGVNGDARVRVTDVSGRIVSTRRLSGGTLDVSGLPGGLYDLHIIDGDAQGRKGRFVKF